MDERRHPPGSGPGWEESWAFDFVAGGGTVAGFVRLALRPGESRAWYWAYVVRPGRPVVVVRDHDVELPRGRELEVRGDGLWAQVICETPFDHWSAGLEASAVAIDDPARAWGDERGDPVALGLDLEWEMQAPPRTLVEPAYVQPAGVHGEVLVGPERLALDGTGWYTHSWGRPGWLDDQWWDVKGHLADGSATAAGAPGPAVTWSSALSAPAGATAGPAALDTRWGADGLPASADLTIGRPGTTGTSVVVTPQALAPVPLDGATKRHGVLVRALCSLGEGTGGGWGWSEWRQPGT